MAVPHSSPLSDARPSLPEVHQSVGTDRRSWLRRFFAFFGPAYLVSVGYMDPGNWATDLEGGARFGYQLIWVLVMSNLMAILLQTLSARLGIVAGRDLAQACRESYPKPVSVALWILCEIAIAATDLAELLGAAIALKLLFGLPLLSGVLIMAVDTLLLLVLTRFGIRTMEALILILVGTIGACMAAEIFFAQPVLVEVLAGLRPSLNSESLYVAIGILGATVMPHNLYLHSALVQTRRFGDSIEEKRRACKFNLIDSAIALNIALFVNGAILVLAAAVFYKSGTVVTEIEQAHQLLAPLLGTSAAGVLFALALLAAGQSSTITGTMAGQIVMEGFLSLRMRPWLRRILTRSLAIVPAAWAIYSSGEQASYQLLILSQVILSLQLPFAVIPLLQLTSDKQRMGEFANATWVKVLGWTSVVIIVTLNLGLVQNRLGEWTSGWPLLQTVAVYVPVLALFLLLLWIALRPVLPAWARADAGARFQLDGTATVSAADLLQPAYCRILVPIDHSVMDRYSIAQAAALAKQHCAQLFLLHVEEGVTSQVYGPLASTAEITEGRTYLQELQHQLEQLGITTQILIRHGRRASGPIIEVAEELKPDLVVMGAHGHSGWKDVVFGNTINRVRHRLQIPLLIVRRPEVV